ncbi:MAG: NDP-sugar synthase [Acidimicrobiales bacterium]|nr:NDP-sugar synthase [Acidimicrobiales bacterium]
MRAVVLVGGFGTRLRPLTLSAPKQMLPVNGVTMLERVIMNLARGGVTEAVLALGYLPEVFQEAFPSGEIAGVTMHYAVEPEPLDTGGAIGFAARAAGFTDETFIAINGDVINDLDIAELVAKHRAFGGEGTIHLTPVDDPSRFGVVPIDEEGRVEAFIEKPPAGQAPSNWINAGTYVLEPSVLDRIPPGEKVSLERAVFPAMVDDGQLYAVQEAGYWVDAGTPQSYLQVALDLINGVQANEPAVAADSVVDDEAVVENSIIGSGAIIDRGAVVRDSMIQRGARIGADAVVIASIVGPNALVGNGARLSDLTVVGDSITVGANTEYSGAKIPETD